MSGASVDYTAVPCTVSVSAAPGCVPTVTPSYGAVPCLVRPTAAVTAGRRQDRRLPGDWTVDARRRPDVDLMRLAASAAVPVVRSSHRSMIDVTKALSN